MTSLLIKHATVLATMDDQGAEIADGALYAVDGWIEQVGSTADLPDSADEVVDLSGHSPTLPHKGGGGSHPSPPVAPSPLMGEGRGGSGPRRTATGLQP